jgi:hypothetical protein
LDTLLRSALAQRLAQHLQSQVEPLKGVLHEGEQSGMGRIGTGLRLGTALPKALLDALGLAREGLDYGAKVGTGAELALNAKLNPFLKLFPDSPGAHLAEQALAGYEGAGTANPIGKARQANEAGAAGNEIAVGIINQFTNPTSYITGGGSPQALAAARAQRAAGGLGLDLNLVNQILYPEGGALATLGSKIGAPLTQKALTTILRDRYTPTGEVGPKEFATYAQKMGLPTPEKVPNEPSDLVPGTANVRQLLRGLQARTKAAAQTDLLAPTPEAPVTPGQGREPLDLMRELFQTGDNGKGMIYPPNDPQFYAGRTGVDEALIPDLLRQLRDEGAIADDGRGGMINRLLTGGAPTPPTPPPTGPLTSDELDTLVNFAYPNREAQANAILKYPNPDDLTEAALNRVGQNADTLANFTRRHPDLAQRLVDLPDPNLATPEQLAEDGLGITPNPLEKAGKWLTRDLVSGLPGINRLGVSGSGALTGTAAGALMPADTPEDRRRNALTGGVAGAGLGLGLSSVAARPALERVTNTAGNLIKEANVAQAEAMARPSKGLKVLGDIPGIWSVQTTENLRNLLQSPATAALWLKNSGARVGEFGKNYLSMVDLYNLGVHDPYDVQPQQTTAILDALGKTGHILKVGRSFQSINGDLIQKLSALDTALVETGLAAANPLYGGIPGAGLALGFGKGYTRAWQHSIYGTLDDFAEEAARNTAWQDEVVPLLKVAATDFTDRHGLAGGLPADGLFAPADVTALAGQAAGDEWQALSDRVVALGEQRAKDILGDFAERGKLETVAGKGIPFIGWAVRAYPRTAKMMLDHPGVSLALTMLMFNAAEGDKREGVPGYQVGNIAVSQDTPLIGGIAKALTGGQPGEMRLNLLSGLSPIGGSMLAEDDLPEDANLYQQAKAAVGRVGFAPSPVIQAIMYGLNKDFQKPGALSRTAGLETVLPGPEVPSIAAGPLNKLREAAGGSAQTSTPHDRKLAEVYYRLTGHVISDPSNMQDPERRALLLDTLNPESEIRKQADREMAIQGTTKSLLSLGSPLTATPRTDIQAQQQQTRQDQQALSPAKYTPQQIAAMAKSRGLNAQIEAYLMGKANQGTQGDVPEILQLTRGASGGERGQDILSGLNEGSLFGGGNYYQSYLMQNLLGIQPTR